MRRESENALRCNTVPSYSHGNALHPWLDAAMKFRGGRANRTVEMLPAIPGRPTGRGHSGMDACRVHSSKKAYKRDLILSRLVYSISSARNLATPGRPLR